MWQILAYKSDDPKAPPIAIGRTFHDSERKLAYQEKAQFEWQRDAFPHSGFMQGHTFRAVQVPPPPRRTPMHPEIEDLFDFVAELLGVSNALTHSFLSERLKILKCDCHCFLIFIL